MAFVPAQVSASQQELTIRLQLEQAALAPLLALLEATVQIQYLVQSLAQAAAKAAVLLLL